MTTLGVAAMAIAQFPFRIAKRHLRWVWEPGHSAVRTIVRLSGWTVAFVVANQVALFVVPAVAILSFVVTPALPLTFRPI